MAKILFGVGVADARNKLGGHVFSKNRFGAYTRMKVSPSQPRSPKQLVVRSAFTAFSKAWGMELTDAQRAAWIALATSNPVPDQFGNPQTLTGLQFYQRVNRNLHTINVPRVDDAPVDQAVQGLTGLSVDSAVSGDIVDLTFTPQTLDPNMHLVVFATPPLSPGRSFFTAFEKLIFADPNDQTGSPLSVGPDWLDVFGQLQETQKLGVSAFVINDQNGAASVAASASGITAL